jgi:hypothetical protein
VEQCASVRTLRVSGESDDAFRARAERAGRIARGLVEACLQNHAVQEMIADPTLPYTEESVRRHPIVRLSFWRRDETKTWFGGPLGVVR